MCQPPALVKPSDSIESDSDKIWKVLEELIETEGKYVADLETLLHVSGFMIFRTPVSRRCF